MRHSDRIVKMKGQDQLVNSDHTAEDKNAARSITPRSGQPLHVLTVTPFYPTARDGASGCFVAEPIAEMSGMGIRCSVMAVEALYRAAPEKNAAAPPASWYRYPCLPGGIGLASAGQGLYLRLRGPVGELHGRSPIDVIHAHGALPCGQAALRLSHRFKIPFVVTVHGLDAFSSRQVGGLAGAWCARESRRVYTAARQVVAVSGHVRDQVLQGTSGRSAVSVVYNGVDPSRFVPGDETDKPMLLTVGNLIPTKGHELIVHALAALRAEFPDLTWELIGDGPELDRVRQLAENLGVLSSIRFRGRQGRAEVAEACRLCTVFVLPSRYEGLGCVYLEAMASGKVAIGCTGQGIEEVIRHGENGWLVPAGDRDKLIEGLRLLLRDDLRRKPIGEMARNTILQCLTLAHQAQRLGNVYRESVG
jgi:glycosyltransferase involved in cell wall biosynthesis